MGRRVSVGVNPAGLGNLNVVSNEISVLTANTAILLTPSGTGAVDLPSNYVSRSGVGANSILPKKYVDNNISPGMLFISFD